MAGYASSAMDEIKDYCARFLSTDFEAHADAYRWLSQCEPFLRLVGRLRDREKGIFDVAAMLVHDDHELHPAAIYLFDLEYAMRMLEQGVPAYNAAQ